jgi:hypothetical protein
MIRWLPLCLLGSAFVFPIGPPNHHTNTPTAPLFRWIAPAVVSGHRPATLDWIERATALGGGADATTLAEMDAADISIVAAGIRPNIARLSFEAGSNLVSATIPFYISTNDGSVIFGGSNDVFYGYAEGDFSQSGLDSTGSKHIDTGLAPADIENPIGFGGWFSSPTTIAASSMMGSRGIGGEYFCELLPRPDTWYVRLGGANASLEGQSNKLFFAIYQDTGGFVNAHADGSVINSFSGSSPWDHSAYSRSMFVYALNNNGSAIEFCSVSNCAGYAMWRGLNSNQVNALFAIVTNFNARIGR